MRAYQTDFYKTSCKVRDSESRLKQAKKITFVLTQLAAYPLVDATCFDVGCSSGTITAALAPLFARMIGLDYDETALTNIDRASREVSSFLRGDAMHLPAADQSVDVVICAQVYEHVPSDEALVAELYRILKPGGIIFFSGPNKLFPIEPHYYLPFLHWLPGKIADRYLQVLGRGRHYYERSRTLWSLRRLVQHFVIQDVTVQVLRYRWVNASGLRAKLLGLIPQFVWHIALPIFPNFNWILIKSLDR